MSDNVLSFVFWLVHVIESIMIIIPWEETKFNILVKLALILLVCCKADSLKNFIFFVVKYFPPLG